MKSLFLAVFLISLSADVLAQTQQAQQAEAADATKISAEKNFSVNASVDVGDNTKELLLTGGEGATNIIEKLAKNLGTTIEKVFPYYTKQAYYQGLFNIISAAFAFIIFSILAILFLHATLKEFSARAVRIEAKVSKLGEKKREAVEEEESSVLIVLIVFLVIFLVGSIIALFVLIGFFSNWMSGIFNPEFGAIQQMIQDAQNLTSK